MNDAAIPSDRASAAQAAHVRGRYRAERLFQALGLGAVGIALGAVVLLVGSILTQSIPALTEHRLKAVVTVDAALVDPAGRRDPDEIRAQGDIYGLVQEWLARQFPGAEAAGFGPELFGLVAPIAVAPLGPMIADNPALIGTTLTTEVQVNSDVDLYLKGQLSAERILRGEGEATLSRLPDGRFQINAPGALDAPLSALKQRLLREADGFDAEITVLRSRLVALDQGVAAARAAVEGARSLGEAAVEARQAEFDAVDTARIITIDEIEALVARARDYRARAAASASEEALSVLTPSYLVEIGGGVIKLERLTAAQAVGVAIVAPERTGAIPAGEWRVREIATPQADRPISDATIVFARALQDRGAITLAPNSTIFTRSDSNNPELAGLAGAIVGSLLTLLVTLLVAVPLGVLTAIYLEEFAPKNRWTDLIEVNINNLAAVPSIVFGLLGLAVFLNFFGMPRSAPIVGGVVLTLMSLPIIIIASRAALKAVPPSIREAALGVGASKTQAVFGHVLPLAAPGILTGSILAMAHALGETAPLLMIGMVAFVADVPRGFTDSATVLPVEIYMWASRPERAWEPRTALAIVILLAFMIAMNALAVWLRRKFERRW
jgi:phosphate transport system permease protein